MKYFINIINCLLVVIIPVVFVLTPVSKQEKTVVKTKILEKQLKSGTFKEITISKLKEEVEEDNQEEEVLSDDDNDSSKKNELEDSTVETEEVSAKEEEVSKKKIVEEEKPVTDVLASHNGKMSGYGPDCRGCRGYLSSGKYVGDGNIYYNDSTYGKVRIVAGDYSLKFGTIVRVKNSRAGNFLAIVLDRGGSIGFEKKFMFDLLYPSEAEALKDEVSYNVTFEILRYGY